MQNDFITGPLGTPEARAIVDRVCDKIREGWDLVVITKDTHGYDYLRTQEGKRLPVKHCVEGTDGWYLDSRIYKCVAAQKNWREAFKYDTFGAADLYEYLYNPEYEDYSGVTITFVGVCTDICVISNVLLIKSHYPEATIVVDASCCAGTTPEMHQKALDVMRSCQIDIINEG